MDNLNRILMWLKTTPYEGVVLGRRDNFKWVTQFNENAVVTNAEVGIAFLIIQRNGKVEMIADSSDCPSFLHSLLGIRMVRILPFSEISARPACTASTVR